MARLENLFEEVQVQIDPETGLSYNAETGETYTLKTADENAPTQEDFFRSDRAYELSPKANIGLGDSGFDEGFVQARTSTAEDVAEYRADKQGIGWVLGAGVGQMATNAATTMVDNTLGTVWGVVEGTAKAAFGDEGTWYGRFGTGYTQNAVSESLNTARKAITKELFPIYETEKSRGAFLNGESFGNFVGTTLGSLGYTLGSIATTGITSGAINNLLNVGKLSNAISTAKVANKVAKASTLGPEAAAATAQHLAAAGTGKIASDVFVDGLTEISKKYANRSITSNLIASTIGGQAESRQEGLEARDNYIAKYEPEARKKAHAIAMAKVSQDNESKNTFDLEIGDAPKQRLSLDNYKTPEQIYAESYKAAYDAEMKKVKDDADTVDKGVYGINSLILSASGMLHATRSLNPTYLANQRVSKELLKKTSKGV